QADAGVARAGGAVAAQTRLAGAAGVDVRGGAEVEAVVPRDDGVEVRIAQSGEPIRARAAVVTAGSWAGPLLARAGHVASLQPVLQTISYFGASAPGGDDVPTFIEWGAPEPDLVWYALGS